MLVEATPSHEVVRNLSGKVVKSRSEISEHEVKHESQNMCFFANSWIGVRYVDVCFGLHPPHLTISCLHHCSLVEPRLDAKLENNRENIEVGEVDTAGADHGLGWVQHLLGQSGCLNLMMGKHF